MESDNGSLSRLIVFDKKASLKEKINIVQRIFSSSLFQIKSYISSLVISDNNDFIVIGYDNGNISVWNLREKMLHFNEQAHCGYVLALAMTKDSKFLFSGGYDCNLIKWDLETKLKVGKIKINFPKFEEFSEVQSQISKYILESSFNLLIAVSTTRHVAFFDYTSLEKKPNTLIENHTLNNLAFSSNKKYLVFVRTCCDSFRVYRTVNYFNI